MKGEYDKLPATTKHALLRIAQGQLRVETLETRHSDSLDFHDVGVGSLREALAIAYLCGKQAGKTITRWAPQPEQTMTPGRSIRPDGL